MKNKIVILSLKYLVNSVKFGSVEKEKKTRNENADTKSKK